MLVSLLQTWLCKLNQKERERESLLESHSRKGQCQQMFIWPDSLELLHLILNNFLAAASWYVTIVDTSPAGLTGYTRNFVYSLPVRCDCLILDWLILHFLLREQDNLHLVSHSKTWCKVRSALLLILA